MSRFTFSLPSGVTVVVEPSEPAESAAILAMIFSGALSASAVGAAPMSAPPTVASTIGPATSGSMPAAPAPRRPVGVPVSRRSPRLVRPTQEEVYENIGTSAARLAYSSISDAKTWVKMAAVLTELGRPAKAGSSVMQALRFAAHRLNCPLDWIIESEQREEGRESVLYVRVPPSSEGVP